MDKPTLTPHGDAVENFIPEMRVQIARQVAAGGPDALIAEFMARLAPEALRVIAMMMDRGERMEDIFFGLAAGLASLALSGTSTITQVSPTDPRFILNIAQIATLFGDALDHAISNDGVYSMEHRYNARGSETKGNG